MDGACRGAALPAVLLVPPHAAAADADVCGPPGALKVVASKQCALKPQFSFSLASNAVCKLGSEATSILSHPLVSSLLKGFPPQYEQNCEFLKSLLYDGGHDPDSHAFPTQGMAEGMLGDGKLEVADVAAATLSGLLKALSPVSAAASRKRYLDAAGAGASKRRRAKQRGAAQTGKAFHRVAMTWNKAMAERAAAATPAICCCEVRDFGYALVSSPGLALEHRHGCCPGHALACSYHSCRVAAVSACLRPHAVLMANSMAPWGSASVINGKHSTSSASPHAPSPDLIYFPPAADSGGLHVTVLGSKAAAAATAATYNM